MVKLSTIKISKQLEINGGALLLSRVKIGLNDYLALWDTGATKSCIDKSVVYKERARLSQIKLQKPFQSQSPNGERIENNVWRVPICISSNKVSTVDMLESSLPLGDILLGMDIIKQGTLLITTYNNIPYFSFEYPAVSE